MSVTLLCVLSVAGVIICTTASRVLCITVNDVIEAPLKINCGTLMYTGGLMHGQKHFQIYNVKIIIVICTPVTYFATILGL